MDIFATRAIAPMSIGRERNFSFDDDAYVFEVLLDGGRCFAFLSEDDTALLNKRGLSALYRFPELKNLHRQVADKCILDGEIVVLSEGGPDFIEFDRRMVTSDPAEIEASAQRRPATFIAHDIVYSKDDCIKDMQLMERKALLKELVKENDLIRVARIVEKEGVSFFDEAGQNGFEGVVGKKKDSLYEFGSLSKDWVAVKHQLGDDFVVCGFLPTSDRTASIVIGQFDRTGIIVYRGLVPIVTSRQDFGAIKSQPKTRRHPFHLNPPRGTENVTWTVPALVCSVSFAARNEDGIMRNPVFVGLKPDAFPDQTMAHRPCNGRYRESLDQVDHHLPPGAEGRKADKFC